MSNKCETPDGIDPNHHFRFRIKFDGRDVAAFSKAGALKRTMGADAQRSGGDPPIRRGREPITLERGISNDPMFEEWAHMMRDSRNQQWDSDDRTPALDNFRRDFRLELHDLAGQIVMAVVVHRAWVSEYTALPDLNPDSDVVAVETLVVQHEGWETDLCVGGQPNPASLRRTASGNASAAIHLRYGRHR